jgi:hypothetical protein
MAKKKAPDKSESAASGGPTVLQFKITLLMTDPPVWRRIQFAENDTLADLHISIQAAFGWEDCHMHVFEVDQVRYMNFDQDPYGQLEDTRDESLVVVASLLPENPRKKFRMLYEYDFGDSWQHEVLFEKRVPSEKKTKYPLCIDGSRACPPEDIGGLYGYADLLNAIEHPDEIGPSELLEMIGPFDPDRFDAKKATREMHKWYGAK